MYLLLITADISFKTLKSFQSKGLKEVNKVDGFLLLFLFI